MRLVICDELRTYFRHHTTLDSGIVYNMLENQQYPEVNFLELQEGGKIKYVPKSAFIRAIQKHYDIHPDDKESALEKWYEFQSKGYTGRKWTSSIGKLLPRMLLTNITNLELEKEVLEFQAHFCTDSLEYRIVEGDEITFWYQSENTNESGDLGKSCMLDKKCFSLYEENAHMAILVKDGLCYARSIIWKKLFYDRIYASSPYISTYFKNKLEEQFKFVGSENINVFIMNIKNYHPLPYLDNMYYCDGRYLSNYRNDFEYVLRDTDGELLDNDELEDDEDDD